MNVQELLKRLQKVKNKKACVVVHDGDDYDIEKVVENRTNEGDELIIVI